MHGTILVVDDEKHIREIISLFLKAEGFSVLEAENGAAALSLFASERVDLVILDILLPDSSGFDICREIRKTSETPILFLSALSDDDYFLLGYRAGADDYIAKPFKAAILAAKVKRMLEKRQRRDDGDSFAADGLRLDAASRICTLHGKALALTPKEFDLLLELLKNRGRVLSRDHLLSTVWGYDFNGGSRVVDNHVKKLRKKLGSDGAMIKTVMSIGYKLEAGV